jgi:hypothetical protein
MELVAKQYAQHLKNKDMYEEHLQKKKKGFSDDPRVMQERVAFAKEGITWLRERLYH